MSLYNITVFDPEEQRNYNLNLNYQDYVRAQADEEFLTLLVNEKRNLEETSTTEDVAEMLLQQSSRTTEVSSPNVVPYPDLNLPSCSSHTDLNKKNTVMLWDYQQTKDLIKSMSTHIGDLNNVKKRKFVFDNIANDLLSSGYSVSATAVQNKWKSLVRSYQKCKDTKTRTGQGPSRFFFFEEMDEILGSKPTNECNHSINSTFLTKNDKQNDQNVEKNNITEEDISDEAPDEVTVKKDKETKTLTSNKKYKTTKMRYMQKKIKEYDERKERHKEKMEMEKKRLNIEEKKLPY